MKKIVNFKELGTDCWAPERFFGMCISCSRYRWCKYSVRQVNEEYDRLAHQRYEITKKMSALRKEG
jgi:hypothetical protein